MLITIDDIRHSGAQDGCQWPKKFEREFPEGLEWTGTVEQTLDLIRNGWGQVLSWMFMATRDERYRINLSGADLQRMDFSGVYFRMAVFHGTNLTGANLTGANLADADLTGAILIEACLRNSSLDGAILHGANLTGADLYDVDLSEIETDDDTILPKPIAYRYDDLDGDAQEKVCHDLVEFYSDFPDDDCDTDWFAGIASDIADVDIDTESIHVETEYYGNRPQSVRFGAAIRPQVMIEKMLAVTNGYGSSIDPNEWHELGASLREKHAEFLSLWREYVLSLNPNAYIRVTGGENEMEIDPDNEIAGDFEYYWLDNKYETMEQTLTSRANAALCEYSPAVKFLARILRERNNGEPDSIVNDIRSIKRRFDNRYQLDWYTNPNPENSYARVLLDDMELYKVFIDERIFSPTLISELVGKAMYEIGGAHDKVDEFVAARREKEEAYLKSLIDPFKDDLLTVVDKLAGMILESKRENYDWIGSDEHAREEDRWYESNGDIIYDLDGYEFAESEV